jgi:hypothetical protein
MTNERSIDELVDEFNAQARAEGRYDGRAFWYLRARAPFWTFPRHRNHKHGLPRSENALRS